MENKETGTPCVFCEIAARRAPATIVREWPDALAFRPRRGGVTDGHILVIPKQHVRDVTEDPQASAVAMTAAAELAEPPCNIITSAGSDATQTVYHLHLHIVPRRAGDGLALPWDQEGKGANHA